MRNQFTRALWLKIVSLVVMATAAMTAHAGIYVDSVKGVDTNPGTATLPVKDIATAIILAKKVDAIVVANGTYTGPKNQNLDTAGKAINIRSVGGAAHCIIDCQGQGQAFLIHSGEAGGTQIIGFTIQNGHAPDNADSNGDGANGGAIYIENSSPTIQQCIFASNSAGNGFASNDPLNTGGLGGDGGAIYIYGGSPLVINCQFLANAAGNGGAGASQVFNDGGDGGWGGNGGAVEVYQGNPEIVNCLFVFNSSGNGGSGGNSDPDSNNFSSYAGNGGKGGDGGAINGNYSQGCTIINCTVIANQPGNGGKGGSSTGSGGHNGGNGMSGSGGGLADDSQATVVNSILFQNAGNDLDGGIVSYSDVAVSVNSQDGGHNLSAAPKFVRNPRTTSTADMGDLHLTPGSPCLNMGNTAAAGLPNVDLDLQPRKQRGGIDLGAYELVNTLPALTSLSATNVPVDSKAFTLTLTGTNFNQTSVVLWNGAPRATTYVSASSLAVNVTAADLAAPATIKISIFNPGNGGGVSKTLTLTVANPKPTLTKLSPAIVPVGSPAFTLMLTGAHFNHTSTVLWNGAKRTTTYVSSTSLTIPVTAADLTSPATIKIEVFNPGPGAGVSETLALTIALPKLALSSGTLTRNAKTGVITVPAVFTNTGIVTAGNVKVTAATLSSSATGTKLPVSVGSLAIGQKATTNLTFPGTVGKKGQTVVLSVTTGFTGGSWTGKLTVTLP